MRITDKKQRADYSARCFLLLVSDKNFIEKNIHKQIYRQKAEIEE